MTHPKIQAIGTANPANKISQETHYSILDSANGMSREEKLVLRKIYARSGIQYRHSVLNEFSSPDVEENVIFHPSGKYANTSVSKRMEIYEEFAADLCMEAAEDCFAQLKDFDKTTVTHLVAFSCTGMYAPGIDIQLVEKLGLNRNVERTCINFMGCYAAINALKTAYHIVRSEPDAVVMLAGVELCSIHYQKNSDPNQVVANALFGDGAGVAIVSAGDNTGEELGFILKNFYAEFEQSASNDMVWRIGDSGFDLRLTPEVPNVVKENIEPLLQKLFAKTNITKNDIDYYAIHPGGTKILEACEQALNISKEENKVSYSILNDYGNMSSVTILFVLKQYLKQLNNSDRGKNVLACAFGPGITMESMIVEIA
ncbi:MAG: type III polyketide synthase [Sphingobacteriales bacterium]|nr:MAG: type III polyketide synthase [Sphingobacteriales bacterium]